MGYENRKEQMLIFTLICLLLGLCALLSSGCSTTPCNCAPVAVATPTPTPAPMPQLSWEVNHPERAEWTKSAVEFVEREFDKLEKASDIDRFCKRYAKVTKAQKVHFWAELFSAMAKFESSWNPKSSSMDVGKPGLRDTYSVGLLQMSVVDQDSYKMPLGYKYEDLLEARPNLDLGIRIMARITSNRGSIVLPTNVYWAVLKEGGKYQKIAEIAAMTSKLPFCNY